MCTFDLLIECWKIHIHSYRWTESTFVNPGAICCLTTGPDHAALRRQARVVKGNCLQWFARKMLIISVLFYPSSSLRDSTTYGVWTHAIHAISSSQGAFRSFKYCVPFCLGQLSMNWQPLARTAFSTSDSSCEFADGRLGSDNLFRWLHDWSVISLPSQSLEYIYFLRLIICIALSLKLINRASIEAFTQSLAEDFMLSGGNKWKS